MIGCKKQVINNKRGRNNSNGLELGDIKQCIVSQDNVDWNTLKLVLSKQCFCILGSVICSLVGDGSDTLIDSQDLTGIPDYPGHR